MANTNITVFESFKRLNLLTSAAGIVFAFFGLVMTGVLPEVVDLVESHEMVPLVGSLVMLLVMWASSSTRDPSWYHPAELGIIGGVVALMLVHTFWTPFADFVSTHQPISGLAVFALMLVAGAIVMR